MGIAITCYEICQLRAWGRFYPINLICTGRSFSSYGWSLTHVQVIAQLFAAARLVVCATTGAQLIILTAACACACHSIFVPGIPSNYKTTVIEAGVKCLRFYRAEQI